MESTARPFTIAPFVAPHVVHRASRATPAPSPVRHRAATAPVRTVEATRTIDLDHEQLTLFEGAPGTRVRVLHGTVWLTQTGVARDAFVRTGAELALHGAGRVVAEGVGPARLQVSRSAVPSPVGAVSARWQRLRDAVSAWMRGRRAA